MGAGAEMPTRIDLTQEDLRVQVIHYTRLAERRPHMERILAETGLKDFPVRWVTEWDQQAVLAEGAFNSGMWGDPSQIKAGSVSLILKHVEAWRAVVAAPKAWHLILEDDLLVPNAPEFLNDLNGVLNELEGKEWDLFFIGLGCELHVPRWKRRRGKRVYWRGWRRGWIWGGGGCSRCTEAYLIHPDFARRLLDSNYSKPPFKRAIDWLLNEAGVGLKARSYWAEPALITQGAFPTWLSVEPG